MNKLEEEEKGTTGTTDTKKHYILNKIDISNCSSSLLSCLSCHIYKQLTFELLYLTLEKHDEITCQNKYIWSLDVKVSIKNHDYAFT